MTLESQADLSKQAEGILTDDWIRAACSENADVVPALLKEVAVQLGLCGIYLSFEVEGDLGEPVVQASGYGLPEGLQAETLIEQLNGAAGVLSGTVTLTGQLYGYLGLSNASVEGTRCNALFLVPSAAQGVFTDRMAIFMQASRLFMLACVMEQRNTRIRELQKDIRYQIVWSECLEWLKTAAKEDEAFFLGLVQRAKIITETDIGALVIRSAAGAEDHWYQDPGMLDQLHAFIASASTQSDVVTLLAGQELWVLDDPARMDGVTGASQFFRNLIRVPFSLLQGDFEGTLFLANKKENKHFAWLDQVYILQMLDQAATIINLIRLMEKLRTTNASLHEEKQQQAKLIQELNSAENQLLQSEKMASIGQLAAGVAHEINNPIGYVSSNLSSMSNYATDMLEAIAELEALIDAQGNSSLSDKARKIIKDYDVEFIREDIPVLLDESLEGTNRVKIIVQDLKDFSRVDNKGGMEPADLHRCLDSTLNIVHNEIKFKAQVVKEYGDIPKVECTASQINQVFMNLLVNAGHAIEKQGTITIRTAVDGDYVSIKIIDNGSGIPPENLPKLFEPFFTTKPVGKGTGLGLSVSYSIVKTHKGTIDVESTVGKGTTFTLRLPIKQALAGDAA